MKAIDLRHRRRRQDFREAEIPADLRDLAAEYREKMIESISDFDDSIMERSSMVRRSPRGDGDALCAGYAGQQGRSDHLGVVL